MTDTTEAKTEIPAADLALIPDALADAGKTEQEIWNEIETAERKGTGEPQEAIADAGAGREAPTGENASASPADGKAGTTEKADEPAKTEPDIWAGASPELKAAFEAERARAEKAENERRAAVGRAAASQRRIDELRRAAQPAPKGGEDKIKGAREKIRAQEQDYPELVKPVAEALDAISEKNTRDDEQRRTAAAAELAEIERTETKALAEKHPDWADFLGKHGGQAFTDWVNDQPLHIRQAADRNSSAIMDAQGAIAFMDAYKAFVAAKTNPPSRTPGNVETQPNPPTSLNDRRRRQLDATATPNGSGGRPVVAGVPETGDPAEIWKAIDAVEAQQRRA